ncbi:hypothetical protein RSAG8_13137, partial [Rhizoctonia solani AG-8 WAC10335]
MPDVPERLSEATVPPDLFIERCTSASPAPVSGVVKETLPSHQALLKESLKASTSSINGSMAITSPVVPIKSTIECITDVTELQQEIVAPISRTNNLRELPEEESEFAHNNSIKFSNPLELSNRSLNKLDAATKAQFIVETTVTEPHISSSMQSALPMEFQPLSIPFSCASPSLLGTATEIAAPSIPTPPTLQGIDSDKQSSPEVTTNHEQVLTKLQDDSLQASLTLRNAITPPEPLLQEPLRDESHTTDGIPFAYYASIQLIRTDIVELPTVALSAPFDSSTPQNRLGAEPSTERLADLDARLLPLPPESAQALEEHVNGKEQESARLNGSSESVRATWPAVWDECSPSSPTYVLDSITSAATLTTFNSPRNDSSLQCKVPAKSTADDNMPEESIDNKLVQLTARPILASNIGIQSKDKLIKHDSDITIDQRSTPVTARAKEAEAPHEFVPSSPAEPLDSTTSVATHITCARSVASIVKSTRTESQRVSNPQALIASSRSSQTDPPLPDELPAMPTIQALVLSNDSPILAPKFSVKASDVLIELNDTSSMDWLSTRSTIRAEEPKLPLTIALSGPTDSINSVLSAATRTAQVHVAESIPERQAEYESDRDRLESDLPPETDHINRRTSVDRPRPLRGTTGPADYSEPPLLLGSEEEQSRHWQGRRPPPSEHRHLSDALLRVEPNMSRQANSIAPPRPHTAADPVPTARPMNTDYLFVHIRSRLASSQRFSELLQDVPPQDLLMDSRVPIQAGSKGRSAPGDDDDLYYRLSNRYGSRRSDSPGRPPEKPSTEPGDHSDDDSALITRVQPFRLPPIHFDVKLKPEVITQWNGDTKKLSKWVLYRYIVVLNTAIMRAYS